jgi:5-methylcytosine-specific restriction protein A
MPTSAPKACKVQGCAAFSCDDSNCLNKKQAVHKPIERTSTGIKRSSRIYHSNRWRKLRAAFMSKHPLCVRCLSYDIVTVATDLDHVVAVAIDKSLQWKTSNMQPLCKSCHSVKTSNEQQGITLDYREFMLE